METQKLSILSFPQFVEGGKLHANILIIPRNINPLEPIDAGFPAFADAVQGFSAKMINSLDGLPVFSDADTTEVTIIKPIATSRPVWEALKLQIAESEGLQVVNADDKDKAGESIKIYGEKSIRKYLPHSYRNSFNFTKPRTRYAVTGDEYHCAVKSKTQKGETKTDRSTISWGKLVALCLRNPLLAEKAGLIYHVVADLPQGMYENGGWLYFDFNQTASYAGLDQEQLIKYYAARIPPINDDSKRTLFAAVQFPVTPAPAGTEGYDEIMREALEYNEGFAKIVHANQPVNDYLLEEEDTTNPPQKDVGIRLGWDDEQVTIWMNRQMKRQEENSGKEVDAPSGVFNYCIDVRIKGDTDWRSQNMIRAPHGVIIQQGNIKIAEQNTVFELGTEVQPVSLGKASENGFWLPMYFTNWAGHSLAIPDKNAEEIYQLTHDNFKEIEKLDKENSLNKQPKKTFHPYIHEPSHSLQLVYGETYEFRVRLKDLSGGGPGVKDEPLSYTRNGEVSFLRKVAARQLEIANIHQYIDSSASVSPDAFLLENIVDPVAPVLTVKRPKMGYPEVVFTDKYKNPDAISRLKAIIPSLIGGSQPTPVEIALPDPDVNSFKVLVEVKSLEMDNVLSEAGKESFIRLYEKDFSFSEEDFESACQIRILYSDHSQVLNGPFLFDHGNDVLELPTARTVRITFTPVIEKAGTSYADQTIRYGKPRMLLSFKHSEKEQELLIATDIKAMYLRQEGEGYVSPPKQGAIQVVSSNSPVELGRLANELNLAAHNLTLEGQKNHRVQFGCSKVMRHSLAPDSSSVSFSSLHELFNHWVVGVEITLNRDWSWDGLEVESFSVFRKHRFKDDIEFGSEELVGTIRVSRTANINHSSIDAERSMIRLIFLDAFDPKTGNDVFPREVFLQYRVKPHLKPGMPDSVEAITYQELHLPITTNPAQVAKLISAGIALSKYAHDEMYSSTEPRQRYLWFEMDQPLSDPRQSYFVRVLNNAPDPMLCAMNRELLLNEPEQAPLSIGDEMIRVIIPGMENDNAGVGAMQEMVASADQRFFMVPLPPGLHESSDELFGFFTYEIRVGYNKKVWSTAQARYGRPLQVNGVQHPAPMLACHSFRRKYIENQVEVNEVVVTAPFANAVLNGKNVTAFPPQTTLWCFLYTQVLQADGKAYRNLLLRSEQMLLAEIEKPENDGNRYGVCSFSQEMISKLLRDAGLPVSGRLSVLCVEMFPDPNSWQFEKPTHETDLMNKVSIDRSGPEGFLLSGSNAEHPHRMNFNPLVDKLGHYKIYRTSALVPVVNICCEGC